MTYSLHTLTDGPPPPSPRTGVARFAQETGLLLGAMALGFWLLALVSYSPLDAAFSTSGDGGALRNWGGRLGALLADASYFVLGYSVWWCLAAGLRSWFGSLAAWMRGGAAEVQGGPRWRQGKLAFWLYRQPAT